MSEQLTVLFEQLRGSQPPAPFAPPEQVRRRGRQRTHRQALAAGSAVLAVAGLGAGSALGTAGGDPTPPAVTPAPSASPPPATSAPTLVPPPSVSASRLLRPADFPSIGDLSTSEIDEQGADGTDWPWVTELRDCPAFQEKDYPTAAERADARVLAYSNTSNEWLAWETVESYPDAAANMADIRKAIVTCPVHQVPDGLEIRRTVVAEHFAGDDSLLVRVRRGTRIDHMVVVRVGNLVATLMYPMRPEAEARDMAAAIVARLR